MVVKGQQFKLEREAGSWAPMVSGLEDRLGARFLRGILFLFNFQRMWIMKEKKLVKNTNNINTQK